MHLFSQYDTIILSGDGEDGIAFICNAFLYTRILNTGREREEILMKEKKKMSLAMQIFIALVLAIIAGLLMQNYADFAESYIKLCSDVTSETDRVRFLRADNTCP